MGTSNGYLLDTHPGNSLRLIVARGTLGFAAQLPAHRWTHVAGTVDVKGHMALYIDGKLVSENDHRTADELAAMSQRMNRLRALYAHLADAGWSDCYEARDARLAIACYAALQERLQRLTSGSLERLPEPSETAADRSYFVTAAKLAEGLEKTIAGYANSSNPRKQKIFRIFSSLSP